jgi:hypothetical protein
MLNSAENQLLLEQIFEDAMQQAAELRLPAPTTDMLTFCKTQLRPSFTRSCSILELRNLAITTAYSVIKFGLSG